MASKPPHDAPSSLLSQALSGGFAGFVGRAVIAPFDVLKIRYQVQGSMTRKYVGIMSSMSEIWRSEGIAGLWKGNIAGMYLYFTYGATQFWSYSLLERLLSDHIVHPHLTSFICGASAGCFSTMFTYPLDILRTKMAIRKDQRIGSTTKMMVDVYRHEGLSGYWKGLVPSLIQVSPYVGLSFMSFHAFQKSFERVDSSKLRTSAANALAGAMAGILSKTCVMPLDVIKRRLQIQGLASSDTVFSQLPSSEAGKWFQTGVYIFKSEGFFALFRGWTPAMLKSAIGTSTLFLVHEFLISKRSEKQMDQK